MKQNPLNSNATRSDSIAGGELTVSPNDGSSPKNSLDCGATKADAPLHEQYRRKLFLVIFASGCLLAGVISWLGGGSWLRCASYILLAVAGLMVVCVLYRWVSGRFTAGSLLLDLGRAPNWKQSMFIGAFAPSVIGMLFMRDHEYLVSSIFGILLVHNFLTGFEKRQLRGSGIWNYLYLVKWGEIQSYYWKRRNCLILTTNRSTYFVPNEVTIVIPIEQREAVDEALEKFLPEKLVQSVQSSSAS